MAVESAGEPRDRSEYVAKADLEASFARMQHAIELFGQKSQTDMANLRADMADRQSALMHWFIGFIVAVFAMLAALVVLDRIISLFAS